MSMRKERWMAALLAAVALGAAMGCAGEEGDEPASTWEEEVPVSDPGEPHERRPFLEVAQTSGTGRYMQTWRDEPVYLFTADSAGPSTCYDACAVARPPLVAQAEPTVDEPLDDDRAGTVVRQDGEPQVTYMGWPLYHFRGDSVPGRPQGHGVEAFGGTWYLVTPEGEPLREGPPDG